MKQLITGSSGHLGEALMRVLRNEGHQPVGLDIKPDSFTTEVGSITDSRLVRDLMVGVDTVFHTATLHKPHVATHSRQAFIETNISGTLNLLEAAADAGVRAFIYTSTTSAFGDALRPGKDLPAAWIKEAIPSIPRNIYGVTKVAAEDLCQLFHRKHGMNILILRTSRFFHEVDDDKGRREAFDDDNLKVNELLYRRADLEDMVQAHLLAAERAKQIGFAKYILSATTPFLPEQVGRLRNDLPEVLAEIYPDYPDIYARLGWRMLPGIDRVYDNAAAQRDLGWKPRYDFRHALNCIASGKPFRSALGIAIGCKGYHDKTFSDGPYPVES